MGPPPPPPQGLIYQAKRHRTHPNTYFALKQRKLQLENSSFRDQSQVKPSIFPLDLLGCFVPANQILTKSPWLGKFYQKPSYKKLDVDMSNTFLVSGFNPPETYARQIGSFPQGSGHNAKYLSCHHLVLNPFPVAKSAKPKIFFHAPAPHPVHKEFLQEVFGRKPRATLPPAQKIRPY